MLKLPPVVALWLTLGFIFYLFRREARQKANISKALWIPLIWLLINGSRGVSQWLSPGSAGGPEAGSPLDAVVFLALIVAGCVVLRRRGVNLSTFAHNNRWLMAFLIYTLISIAWSDFPFIASKRWIKVLGHPIMALVVLTELEPVEAVKKLLKRIAYVHIPLSICFIKYFPLYSRSYDEWSGQAFDAGVATGKNQLGCLCMILGMFFFWNTLQALKIKNRKARRNELILSVGFFALNWWVLSQAQSSTSLITMLLGMALLWLVDLPFVEKRYVGWYLATAVLLFAILEPFFGFYENIVQALGRNLTLTGRTDLWDAVLKLQDNPIFGVGFESFWLGERLALLWKQFNFCPIQAHNGYIEIYLNLGLIGIALVIGQFFGTFQKIQRDLVRRFEFGRLRLAFLVAIIVYNYTEAAFVTTSFLWTMFVLIAADYPSARALVRRPIQKLQERKLVPV
jgi:O-antigen ligase